MDTTTNLPTIGQYLAWDGVSQWVPESPAMAPVTSVNGQTGVVVLDSDDIAEGVTNLYYTEGRFDTSFSGKDTDDLTEGATNFYYIEGRFDSSFGAKDTDDLSEGATNLYYTTTRFDLDFSNKDTDDLSEGATNLYYTEGRFDSSFSGKTTDDLTQGSSNLYYASGLFDTDFSGKNTDDLTEGSSNYYYTETRFDSSFSGKTTTDLTEGTNLYYTEARVSANTSVAANTAKVSADGSIDTHSDVDTTTIPPSISDYLLWDGSNWVPGIGSGGSVSINTDAANNTVNPNDGNLQKYVDAICAPDTSQKPTYLGNGEIDFVEYFKGAVQTTVNRIKRVDVAYTGDDPTSEVWKLYDTDGTTVLKTVTFTHTWSGNELTNTTTVTT